MFPHLEQGRTLFREDQQAIINGGAMEKECPQCLMMIPEEATVCPCCKKKFAKKINVSAATIKRAVIAAFVLSVLLSLAFIFRYDKEYIQGPLYRYDRFTSTVEIRRTEGDVIKWVPLPQFKNLQQVRDVRTKMLTQEKGMITGGPLNGTRLPGSGGGMIVEGPLNGTHIPSGSGGMTTQDCYQSSILSPSPFMGNNEEIFKLADGSLWKVKYEYQYLYEYRPDITLPKNWTG
jgi:hypothetical protein